MLKELILISLSLVGFAISFHIWNTIYKQKKKLKCIIGDGGCNEVVKSDYGKILGLDNTFLGMFYYLFILFSTIAFLIYPSLLNFNYVSFGIIGITGSAALFSFYLLFVQFFILKRWCEYCSTSAVLSIGIFLVEFLM